MTSFDKFLFIFGTIAELKNVSFIKTLNFYQRKVVDKYFVQLFFYPNFSFPISLSLFFLVRTFDLLPEKMIDFLASLNDVFHLKENPPIVLNTFTQY